MKPKLLRHYFDANYYLNTVVAAAFNERAEWPEQLLVDVMIYTSHELKAPERENPYTHLAGWERAGWLTTEKREGVLWLKAGRTHEGRDVRQLCPLLPEITDAVRQAISQAERVAERLRKYREQAGEVAS